MPTNRFTLLSSALLCSLTLLTPVSSLAIPQPTCTYSCQDCMFGWTLNCDASHKVCWESCRGGSSSPNACCDPSMPGMPSTPPPMPDV